MSDPIFPYLVRQIIITIGTVGLFSLIILVTIRLFRIINPSIRYLFLTIPLIKGLLAMVREPVEITGQQKGIIFVGARLADPGFLPKLPYNLDFLNKFPFFISRYRWDFWPTILLIIAAVSFLIWRAYGLWKFNRLLALAPEVEAVDYPDILKNLRDISASAKIKAPKLVVIKTNAAPFTLGVLQPVIVLSPSLITNMSSEEMMAVLAHEVAHISRRDYLYHWMIIALRDLMYFNPLTHLIYRRLNFEKERACDSLAALLTKKPLELAKGLISVAELRKAEPAVAFTKSFVPQNLIKKKDSEFSRRVKDLIEPRASRKIGWGCKMIIMAAVILLLYLEIHLGTFLIEPALIIS